eukprot:CAMPEP_0119317192 /NCGR_PEP_ID=MMETSP1333-20130426/42279_1 /TAXON_ID=418940 /ORGANISM="Scyphosphaera apsteinii, Strain RCC1455" /LENGTH=241 /DNA_ID=CAMNT_0007323055 /DNA_START=35 /DNA_END=760 /DNA_ORIENTATION=+
MEKMFFNLLLLVGATIGLKLRPHAAAHGICHRYVGMSQRPHPMGAYGETLAQWGMDEKLYAMLSKNYKRNFYKLARDQKEAFTRDKIAKLRLKLTGLPVAANHPDAATPANATADHETHTADEPTIDRITAMAAAELKRATLESAVSSTEEAIVDSIAAVREHVEGGSLEQASIAAEAAADLLTTEIEDSTAEFFEVVCPAELAMNREMRIALPDGREFGVLVPDSIEVGEWFLVGPFTNP